MKGLEDHLSEMEQIADRAMAQDDYPVPDGKDTLVQSMGRELKACVHDIRAFVAEGGEADIAACWMHDAQELRAELVFTMADPDASRTGMGSLHRSDDAVATAAAKGRRFRPGRPRGSTDSLGRWLQIYARRNPGADFGQVWNALLLDPNAEKGHAKDTVWFDGKQRTRKTVSDRWYQVRKQRS